MSGFMEEVDTLYNKIYNPLSLSRMPSRSPLNNDITNSSVHISTETNKHGTNGNNPNGVQQP
jgi:hypothetical protein